jgi:hypothetical protein
MITLLCAGSILKVMQFVVCPFLIIEFHDNSLVPLHSGQNGKLLIIATMLTIMYMYMYIHVLH